MHRRKKTILCMCEYDPLEYFGQESDNQLVCSALMKHQDVQHPLRQQRLFITAFRAWNVFQGDLQASESASSGKMEKIIIHKHHQKPILMSELWHSDSCICSWDAGLIRLLFG